MEGLLEREGGRREGERKRMEGWRDGKGKRGGREGGQGGREDKEDVGEMEEKKGEKDEGRRKSRKKNQLHTISTTWHANAQHLPFWMNTVTCSPHNILKVKEVLDKEPTHKVLYLLPLFVQCVSW